MGAPSGVRSGTWRLNKLVAPTGKVRRMTNRLNWSMKVAQACWIVVRSGKLEGKVFAIAGIWSRNGWRKPFKRKCGPSHKNRSSNTGGRMTATWLATESKPRTRVWIRPGGGGSLNCCVSIEIDFTTGAKFEQMFVNISHTLPFLL